MSILSPSSAEDDAIPTGESIALHDAVESSPSHGRIDDIELLRAVAIILVLIQHIPLTLFGWIGGLGVGEPIFAYFAGWQGVDLFFAISGFVIARSLMPSLAEAKNVTAYVNSAVAFWVRRAWRLLPSAWLWLAIGLVATLVLNRSGAFGNFLANYEAAIAAILNVANFRQLMVFGRYDIGLSSPYWSLSLEEQFYFLFPFLVLFAGRRLALVAGAGVLLQLFIPRNGPDVGTLGLILDNARSDAILLGVLIAIWSDDPTYRLFEPVFLKNRPIAGIILFAGLIILLAAAGAVFLHIAPFQVGLVALISALLVLIASYNKNYFLPNGPFKTVMLWLGTRSYALYLVHIPMYALTREIWYRLEPPGTEFTDRFAVRFVYTAAILVLMSAELNYRLIEVPLRQRGARIAKSIARRPLPGANKTGKDEAKHSDHGRIDDIDLSRVAATTEEGHGYR